ncbi:MAG: PatB family C-S lyase [Oscillospiraceae bacterium]|nr:PatB family C-S lyase [Oscillospiraceae bacterium]
MSYDFENVIDRSKLGSSKWLEMLRDDPDIPEGIVPLSVADMELKNAPEIMEGLREYLDHDKTTLGYTTFTDSYNDAVAGWMKSRHGWDVDMQWNITTPGVVNAFFNAVRAFTEPGDGVIIFTPVYYPFMMAAESNGRAIVDVPLKAVSMRYEIDWEGFEEAAAAPKNKLLLFCSPHNPVGRVWLPEELKRLSSICIENDVLMLSDEIHNDLIMPGYKHTVYALLSEDAKQNCIICTSPSKTFSLAGLQTSNIFIPNEKLRGTMRKEMMRSAVFSLNAIGYKACELAYTKCEGWLNQVIELIDRNAKYVESFMAANIPQIKVFPLEGTYLQWWDCRELFGDHLEMERFMRRKAYLYFDEGYFFGETGKGFERINLACPESTLRDALDRLHHALQGR